MKIASHDIALAARRVYGRHDQEHEELKEWGTPARPGRAAGSAADRRTAQVADRVSLSRASARNQAPSGPAVSTAEAPAATDEEQGLDARLMTLKRMIESITGRKISLTHVWKDPETAAEAGPQSESAPQAEAPAEQEWGMSYTRYTSHYEYEQTDFAATGTVRTADGQEISFAVNLSMSREYFSEERLTVTAGAPLIDPLVINYDGRAAELEDLTFEFDLDSDGKNDTLHTLAPGSGFLVFDRNADGRITNGTELFGPQSGDGFAELAVHDQDANGWIDENDAIYRKLALWRRENGTDLLTGLAEAKVGAIYLGRADTDFDLTDADNALQGRIRKTGIYLKEGGGAGTVQQIDFSA
ncbi:hypothetical protein JCM14469_01180 [Desulfatiferula olefinivorans]